MKNKIKFILLLVFCLCILQNDLIAQSTPVDDEIKSLENRLVELKKQKIASYEAEIKRMQTEVDKLKSGPNENTDQASVSDQKSASQTTAIPQNIKPIRVSNNSVSNPNALPNQQLANRCLPLDQQDILTRKICAIARAAIEDGSGKIDLDNSKAELANIIASKIIAKPKNESLLAGSEKKRTDKQVGSSPNSSGTTSLVVKGGAPTIIGWAIENGSATSSVNGNTVTVRVNPYNLGNALFQKQSLFDIKNYAESSKNTNGLFEENLKKLTLGFSFDTTRGQETPTFIVSKQQLSSWSARYEFINHRNPLSKFNEAKRNQYFSVQAPILDAFGSSVEKLFSNSDFKLFADNWLTTLNSDFEASADGLDCKNNPNKITNATAYQACINKAFEVIKAKLDNLPVDDVTKNTVVMENFKSFMEANDNFITTKEKFLEEVNKGTVATLEYTNNREVNAPDTSNLRFIWEKGLYKNIDFTLNAEMTMFNKKPLGIGIKRIKDFNFALQFDAPFKDFGNTILSGSVKYTRQQGNVVLPNGFVADGTKGDILFGQAKLTIPFGDTGIKFPFSFTVGNRSEFIKEKFSRANFGVTFDLDQIFRPINFFK
jgi:hypothetical protein